MKVGDLSKGPNLGSAIQPVAWKQEGGLQVHHHELYGYPVTQC